MDEEIAECLLLWVQTFSVQGEKNSVQELSDGVALCYVLHEVSSTFFSNEWIETISKDSVDNKHLKISNLKKVLKGVLGFYENELNMRISESKKPNLKAIVESSNLIEMGRLLQLVLGCAVNCDNKTYIEAIMSMEESVQHGVMTAIQELMSQESSQRSGSVSESDVAAKLEESVREIEQLREANNKLQERCNDLDIQVAMLQEDRSHLDQTDSTTEKSTNLDDLEDPNTAAGKKYLALQEQLEQYKDEVYRLDAAKEDYRVKYENTHREHEDIKQKNESLTALADEARHLKDEVDVLRQNEEKIKVYETSIEAYKRKIEELSDIKRQVRLLEEQNTSYMEKSVEWEDEAKKTSSLKSQIEVYKRQVQELQTKITNETKRADKSEFDVKRTQDKMSGIQKENDRIRTELNALKESNEELQFSKLSSQANEGADGVASHVDMTSSLTGSLASELSVQVEPMLTTTDSKNDPTKHSKPRATGEDDLDLLSLPLAIREKFIRLQKENKVINKRLEELGDTTTLQLRLDDAETRVSELESENRIGNLRVMELEAQVQDLQEASQTAESGESGVAIEYKKKVAQQTTKVKSLEGEVEKKKQYIDTADSRISELNKLLKEKDEKLSKRENEMKEMDEKYKRYLEKAKSVIDKLENNQGADGASPQLEKLRPHRIHERGDSLQTKPIRQYKSKLSPSVLPAVHAPVTFGSRSLLPTFRLVTPELHRPGTPTPDHYKNIHSTPCNSPSFNAIQSNSIPSNDTEISSASSSHWSPNSGGENSVIINIPPSYLSDSGSDCSVDHFDVDKLFSYSDQSPVKNAACNTSPHSGREGNLLKRTRAMLHLFWPVGRKREVGSSNKSRVRQTESDKRTGGETDGYCVV